MTISSYILSQFAAGKLTHNAMSAALVTTAVKTTADSLNVEPAPVDYTRLRKPYRGNKPCVSPQAVAALSGK